MCRISLEDLLKIKFFSGLFFFFLPCLFRVYCRFSQNGSHIFSIVLLESLLFVCLFVCLFLNSYLCNLMFTWVAVKFGTVLTK